MVDVYLPNKRPGACFYCARRVKTGEGSLWRSSQGFHVAHGACLHENIAAGREPERMDSKSTAAWLVKECRAVLKAVRMDGTEAELEGAVARMRAVLAREPCEEPVELEAAPF